MAGEVETQISLIAAVADNGIIGDHGKIPWDLPDDRRHFRDLTWGKLLLVGRKTWEAMGGALPGRETWVLSRQPLGLEVPVFPSVDVVLAAVRERAVPEVMVIGGSQVYRAFWELAEKICLTEVRERPPGDARFPPVFSDRWQLVHREMHSADARHACDFNFAEYRRRREVQVKEENQRRAYLGYDRDEYSPFKGDLTHLPAETKITPKIVTCHCTRGIYGGNSK